MLVAPCWAPLLLGSVHTDPSKEQVLLTCFLRPWVFLFTWDLVSTAAPFYIWTSPPRSLGSEANPGLELLLNLAEGEGKKVFFSETKPEKRHTSYMEEL